jgi:hypothetical protein
MSYPEEPVSYCERCDVPIPAQYFWRGRGFIIGDTGQEERTPILYSQCPECGQRLSTGLLGPWWYRTYYAWLWKLRYPNTRPAITFVREQREQPAPRRRAAGE